jgi:hypothetical protein
MRRLSPFSNNHLYVSLLMDNTHAENAQFAFVFEFPKHHQSCCSAEPRVECELSSGTYELASKQKNSELALARIAIVTSSNKF